MLYNNGYYILNENTSQIEKIKKELTVEPKLYYEYIKPPVYKLYKEIENYLIIPRFYGIKKLGIPKTNKILDGNDINISFKGNLRDNQKNIIDLTIKHLKDKKGGVLCLPCGFGKTVMGIYIINYFKKKTLIVVHKTFLLNQWIERINEFTDAKIGVLQQNIIDVKDKDIVIGMLQSISKEKYDNDIFKEFGIVIFDEAHHAPSEYFSKSLPIISSKITLGLSATPKRQDKLEKILFWYFGDIIYKHEIKKNKNINIILNFFESNNENFREFKMKNGDINRALMINKLIDIKERNELIIEIINKNITIKDRQILILSDRIEHLKILKNYYSDELTSYYIGGMNKEELDKSKMKKIIFGTYSMASEGLDIPSLNTLIMATPRTNIEQSVGRVTRKIDYELKPTIYDIIDKLSIFMNQYKRRMNFYKKNDYNISNHDNKDYHDNDNDNDENILTNDFFF